MYRRSKFGRIHYRYTRTLADLLPWQGVPLTSFTARPKVLVRRGDLPQDDLRGAFARPRRALCGRRTERLHEWFTHVSFALGGEAGSRLLRELGGVLSGDTLLNHIRSMRLPNQETPRVLSVDDFAFRRGSRYGTILVDLESRELVDVLADRSADMFARWLTDHPGVEIVSRDRGGEYAEAARRAAPSAVQVAERLHLLKNLRDVVSRVFRQSIPKF